jgi:hypothetical protein
MADPLPVVGGGLRCGLWIYLGANRDMSNTASGEDDNNHEDNAVCYHVHNTILPVYTELRVRQVVGSKSKLPCTVKAG